MLRNLAIGRRANTAVIAADPTHRPIGLRNKNRSVLLRGNAPIWPNESVVECAPRSALASIRLRSNIATAAWARVCVWIALTAPPPMPGSGVPATVAGPSTILVKTG